LFDKGGRRWKKKSRRSPIVQVGVGIGDTMVTNVMDKPSETMVESSLVAEGERTAQSIT
jgi:hypothetical protein